MNYYESKCDGIAHVIKKGDTLYRLSRIYGVSVDQIIDANPGTKVYNLAIGDTLCIPMVMSGNIQGSVPSREESGTQNQWQTGAGLGWDVIMPYTVKEGDSLNSILSAFAMDFETFAKLNPELMPTPLDTGKTVNVKRKRIVTRQ